MIADFNQWAGQQAPQAQPAGVASFQDWQQKQGSPAGGPPKYRDVWNYGSAERATDFQLPPDVQAAMDRGEVSRTLVPGREGSNEGGGYSIPDMYQYSVDPSKLPTTRYGDVNSFRPYDVPSGQGQGGFKLRNSAEYYDDPNYGPITPMSNLIDPSKQRNFYDMIGPLVMSGVLGAAGAGMFGATLPGQGTALGLGRAAISAAQSGGASLPASAASFLGNASGIPFGGQAASMLVNAAQGHAPSPVSAGLSFAQWLARQGG